MIYLYNKEKIMWFHEKQQTAKFILYNSPHDFKVRKGITRHIAYYRLQQLEINDHLNI
jgi:hypothetical protein